MAHLSAYLIDVPKVYLETTIFNFHFAGTRGQFYGKTVDYCRDTRRFFDAVRDGDFEAYTSLDVINELLGIRNEAHKDEILKLIDGCRVVILPHDETVGRLARMYVEAGAVPKAYMTDARHIAATAVHGLDLIVSLNFRYIVKEKAGRITAQVNAGEGLGAVEILEPEEALKWRSTTT